ncbi:proteasome assembly chaperone family protein [Candidatus Borrarchaeum sp.]|uniref:proteasome assembly chaperone family protein n=1 Tax=Candidatus Borrarchaeum sp. TaxID=2846742 RepID=UPI00257B47F6|nr:PAC2 family protein [Candidatus Borrarchaeum sp.]
MSSNDVKINVSEIQAEKPYVLIGLPDVGLIGVISASQLIKSLNMKPIGSIDSEQLPPIAVIHETIPMAPLRVYGAENVILVVSEIPLPPTLIRPFSKAVVNWAKRLNPTAVLSLAGIPVPNRMDIEQPGIYAVSSGGPAAAILGDLESIQVQKLEEGFMAGPYASILNNCITEAVPNITFLVQSHMNYPDPGAAAILLETVAKFLNVTVDVEPLLEQAEEIRLRMRDTMRRTSDTMQQVDKTQEYEIPAFYG